MDVLDRSQAVKQHLAHASAQNLVRMRPQITPRIEEHLLAAAYPAQDHEDCEEDQKGEGERGRYAGEVPDEVS